MNWGYRIRSVEEEDAENIANALKIFLDKVDSPNPMEKEAINKFLAWVSFEDEKITFLVLNLVILFILSIP